MIATLDLEHCLHAGLTNMQVDTFAGMLYLDEVGTAVGEDGQQPCQGSGSIADASEQYESSAHACFVAPDEARQYSEIYVAAREHHARAAVGGWPDASGHQR